MITQPPLSQHQLQSIIMLKMGFTLLTTISPIKFFFSWSGGTNYNLPKYSIYDCATSSFIASDQVIPGNISTYSSNVISCYNQQTNEIFFSWSEDSTLQPYYAIYDCNLSTFTRTATLLSSTITVKGNIACCYNAKMNQIIFNWANFNENLNPYYAIYDCNTSSITTPATLITSTSQPDQDVFSSYIILNNEVVFNWIDGNSSTPYFAIYNCTNQSFTTPATQISDIQGSTNMLSSYNSELDQVVFSFAGATTLKPYYAIYDCNRRLFSVHPTLIGENIKTAGLISTSYNNTINQTIFSWADFSDGVDQLPYYTIYTYPTSNHHGKRKKLKNGALHSWSRWIKQKGGLTQ